MTMETKGAEPIPVQGGNKLAELHEFVVTYTEYRRYLDFWGREQVYVFKQVVK